MVNEEHILSERRRIWSSKTVLVELYARWCRFIAKNLAPGNILELGGGSGNLQDFFPDMISSDIVFAPWLDAVSDAHHLPFKSGSFNNIIMVDVLHHLIEPVQFFSEAQRVLRRQGRMIIVEPYVSWLSFFVYCFFHREGLDLRWNPFEKQGVDKQKVRAFSGNQAASRLIFKTHRQKFEKKFPRFKILEEEFMDFLLYPLSGGFHHPTICPETLYPVITQLESRLRPLKKVLAFRVLLVLESF